MKYVVIHLRTGGLDPDKHSLIEVAAMIEDTTNELSFDKIPKIRFLVEQEVYHGEPYALYLNRDAFAELNAKPEKRSRHVVPYESVAITLYFWIIRHIETWVQDFKGEILYTDYQEDMGTISTNLRKAVLINTGGKNFGSFTSRFLNRVPKMNQYIQFHHRIIDPAILYIDLSKDEFLPGTEQCKSRAGIETFGTSDPLTECKDTIILLRQKLK